MKGARVAPNGEIQARFDVNTGPRDQLLADLAFDGSNYLVAWGDRRHLAEQVYYTMVTPEGVILNDSGCRISGQDSLFTQTFPAVATNGREFLVAWLGSRMTGNVILAVRIDADGRQLDSTLLELSGDTILLERVVTASDGADFLAAWTAETPGGPGLDLWCRRVSAAGQVLDSGPTLVASSRFGVSDPDLVFRGDGYFLVWSGMAEEADIWGARIARDGTVLDPGGFPILARPGLQREPDVATDGAAYLVVWSDFEQNEFDINGVLVDSSGTVGAEFDVGPPARTALRLAAMPNPVRIEARLAFDLPQRADVRLAVYDAAGRLVRNLVRARMPPGRHVVAWDRRDEMGRRVAAGTCLVRLQADTECTLLRLVMTDREE